MSEIPSGGEGSPHLDASGKARMVDVSTKEVTHRTAVAEGRIVISPPALQAITEGTAPKGDVLAVARIAGTMAAKRTADLIPLCHPLPGTSVALDLEVDPDLPGVVARAQASVAARTGVEMEAMTAVAVALLTIYDMVKGLDRSMRLEGIRLVRKEGGRSGVWVAEEEGGEPPGSG